MQAEGANSPADVLLTVDTSRLERAKNAGVLQAIESDVLEGAIPAALQDSDNQWFGFSQRARIIFYDKTDVTNPPMTYVDLADPAYAGMVCHRSSSNVYSQTLLSAVIENHAWCAMAAVYSIRRQMQITIAFGGYAFDDKRSQRPHHAPRLVQCWHCARMTRAETPPKPAAFHFTKATLAGACSESDVDT